jgi:hypothetical protein
MTEPTQEAYDDWTALDGRCNSSPRFLELCAEIERLIRGDAHMLIAGRADKTARLILAQLAHKHGVGPLDAAIAAGRAQAAEDIRAGMLSGVRMPDDLAPAIGRPSTTAFAGWAARIAETGQQ